MMSHVMSRRKVELASAHMEVNFMEAAGWFLSDLNGSGERTKRLMDYFKGEGFGTVLNRVKDVMKRRGVLASGRLDIVVEPDGVVSIHAEDSNLQLQDQEQIRRDVVKVLSQLKSETRKGTNVVHSRIKAYAADMLQSNEDEPRHCKTVPVLMAESLVLPVEF